MAGVKVLVVGHARLHREMLAAFLETVSGLEVLAAVDLATADRAARAMPLDVVVVIDAAGGEVATTIKAIAESGHRVVAIGTEQTLGVCAAAGASGLLLMESAPEELSAAVEVAASGGTTFGPAVVAILLKRGTEPERADALTPRELQVVALVADGLSNKQIAGRLYIERHTVKNHLNNAYRKLGVCNRIEAVARVQEFVA